MMSSRKAPPAAGTSIRTPAPLMLKCRFGGKIQRRKYRWIFVTKLLLTFYCESIDSLGNVHAVGSSPGHCTVSSRLDTRWPDDSLGSNTLPMFASSQLGIQLGSCLLALGNGWIIVWINDEITWAQVNCTLPQASSQKREAVPVENSWNNTLFILF